MMVIGGDSWTAAYGAAAITAEALFRTVHDKAADLFPSECYEESDYLIHPFFLKKAYGLGARAASVVRRFSHSCHC